MPRTTSLDLLPLRNETWYVYIWKARIWITPPGEEPYRPYACLILNLGSDLVQNLEIFESESSAEVIYELLTKSMRSPKRQIGARRGRPTRILFHDAALAGELADRLQALGILTGTAPLPELADTLVAEMEGHMGGFSALPGLLSVAGVTPELAGGFFAAAAALIDAEPWTRISDEHKFAIKIPQEDQPRIIALMGYAGMEYGVASYMRWEDVEAFYRNTGDPSRAIPNDGMRSVFFNEALETPIDDLEAAAQYGWRLAGQGLYPVPLTFLNDEDEGGVRRPSAADLVFYEVAFQAFLVFIDQHLVETRLDSFHSAEATVRVQTHAGEVSAHLRYPAGALSDNLARRDRSSGQYSGFDRRLMEKTISEITGGFADPLLEQAQQVMYRAFAEMSSRRRIALAHQALSISPDCADAYVLLAEEEAGTDEEALALFDKGVTAGRRALGDTFEELGGHFWMALETRPYMRARAGQANLLWALGRNEAAARNYRELLVLNPGDNQGVRYSLLQLLLDMGRDKEAANLIEEYPDDASTDFLYTRTLLAFRETGPAPAVDKLLKEAVGFNAWVPDFLTTRKRIPGEEVDALKLSGEDEAAAYARRNLSHWRRTAGALDWLKRVAGKSDPDKPRKRTKRGRRNTG